MGTLLKLTGFLNACMSDLYVVCMSLAVFMVAEQRYRGTALAFFLI